MSLIDNNTFNVYNFFSNLAIGGFCYLYWANWEFFELFLWNQGAVELNHAVTVVECSAEWCPSYFSWLVKETGIEYPCKLRGTWICKNIMWLFLISLDNSLTQNDATLNTCELMSENTGSNRHFFRHFFSLTNCQNEAVILNWNMDTTWIDFQVSFRILLFSYMKN